MKQLMLIAAMFCLIPSVTMPVQAQITITNPADIDQAKTRLPQSATRKSSIQRNSWITPSSHISGNTKAKFSLASHSNQESHVQVSMVKLLVDCETRNAIYHSVGEPGFTTRTTTRPPQPPTDLAATFEPMESYLTVRSPTTSAMVVIDGSVSDRVIATVRAAGQSKVKQSPTLVLTAAKVAEINDIMERPFATGFDPQHSQVKVENFEAGMRIRMLASPGDGFIRFVAEIISSRITSVGKAELPQYSAEPIVVQTPIQATQSVVVNANLPTGHSLLIDPHVTQTDSFEQEIAAPMFGKLPYVGKNFRDTETVQVDRHVLVLITPESSRQ